MAKIHCDCGAEMDFAPVFYREGDLEITCLRCSSCATEYVASVTDSTLRDDVKRYQKMADAMKRHKMPDAFKNAAERLKERNVQRSKMLRQQYVEIGIT